MIKNIEQSVLNISYYPLSRITSEDKKDFTDVNFRVIEQVSVNVNKGELKKKVFQNFEKYNLILKDGTSEDYLMDKVQKLSNNTWEHEENYEDKDYTVSGKVINDYKDFFSNVKDEINKISIKKFLSEQNNIIITINKASNSIFNFFEKVSAHTDSLPHDKRIKNFSSLKGIVIDNIG